MRPNPARWLKRRLSRGESTVAPAVASDGDIVLGRAVIVHFSGGLANQMLCYKLLRYLAELNDATAIIDATAYDDRQNAGGRNFQMMKYALRYDLIIFSRETLRRIRENNAIASVTGAELRTMPPGEAVVIDKVRSERLLLGDLWLAFRLRETIDNEAGRNGALDDLTLDPDPHFSDSDRACLAWIRACRAPVAVHVRRGDFATHDGNLLLTSDYYNRAIAEAESRLDEPSFLVISDDIEWCRQNLTARGELRFVDFHNDQDAYKDMFLASQCRHFILSNESTFSHQIVQLNRGGADRLVITSTKDDLVRSQAAGKTATQEFA